MELYNKDTFSEDILPVVIVGKSCHNILSQSSIVIIIQPIFVLLFLSHCHVCSRLYFSEQFEMLYCSQGPELTNGLAQMESVRAEMNACYSQSSAHF